MTGKLFVILSLTASFLLSVGVLGIYFDRANTYRSLMALLLILMGLFIAYGLDTQCADYGVYIYCGDE